jgi:hypothetical protein
MGAGQFWMIEWSPGTAPPAPQIRTVALAQVIIYDRALGSKVAAILPLGRYAEPALVDSGAGFDRGVRFAMEGWSVVGLVDERSDAAARARRVRQLAARWLDAGAPADLPVVISGAGTTTSEATWTTPLANLGNALALSAPSGPLTIVFAASGSGMPYLYDVSSNGLAG